ncbi:putative lipoprotein [Leptospira weilii serovar Ranarum str. ICFT]|uniref:Lipoprotein n=1 Tax=Leptospira weilii serovar Ranarum str. ICFT TaxID=1218598 RepID=N1WPC6_9LEPT|nr:hypothetical protein [Leptospira weilii]EMY77673.1 putative lipoprotein [Leptospira weilii serovar Ranarum str. ICFT]
MKQFIALVIASIAIGCVSLPENLKKKSVPESSILAIAVDLKPPIGIFSQSATEVLFVKLPDPKDKKSVAKKIHGNFSANGYVYLINAEPGIYSILLSGKQREGGKRDSCAFLLDIDSIQKIKIKINKNEMVYAGKYVIQSRTSLVGGEADWANIPKENLNDELNIFDGDSYSGDFRYPASLEKVESDAADKQKFLEKAKAIFSESEWISLVK